MPGFDEPIASHLPFQTGSCSLRLPSLCNTRMVGADTKGAVRLGPRALSELRPSHHMASLEASMKERFATPPLVELVAELRWQETEMPAGFPQFPGVPFPFSESFDKRMSILLPALASLGYGASERLFPPGFPLPLGAPACRFKFSGPIQEGQESLASTLFQLGAGIFTANALQPYKSWDEFSPTVKGGVDAFLKSHPSSVSGYSLLLRYIDAFSKDLLDGRTNVEFLQQVLGIEVRVPEIISGYAAGGGINLPLMQIGVPLDFGFLQIQFADGVVDNTPVFLMETTVTITGEVSPDVNEIMGSFERARNVIHNIFVGITKPIHEQMKPIVEG